MDGYRSDSPESPREEQERPDASGNALLAAALAYGRAGLPVFPCRPDKRPLISAWPTEASTDADVIHGWWGTWPNAWIGLVTGARSGLLVVDIDVKEGRDGMAAYRALNVPRAEVAARTPSGGGHAYFRWPGDGWGNTASKIAPGIDTRGEGGYVIAPPSAEGEYRWLADTMGEALLEGNVPELPEVIRSILAPAAELSVPVPVGRARSSDRWADKAVEEELHNVRSAAAGSRNAMLNVAAFNLGQIVADGHRDRSMVENELLSAALATGLGEREAEATIRSGLDSGERNPRGPKKQPQLTFGEGAAWPEPNLSLLPGRLDPPPDFPGEAVFGKIWSGWITDAAAAASAPPDYVALTLLTVAGSLIGNARWVSPWAHWSEPPIIWGMIVGGPSAGKTPAMKTVITALRAVENRVRQAAEKVHEEWQKEASLAELRRKEWERRAAEISAHGGTPPPPPEGVTKAPHTPRLTVSDVTIEKLGDILASQPRGCLLIRDELAGFFGTMGRYTAGGGGDRQFWIEAFNGGPFSVERLSRGSVRIDNLSIGLLGGIQPDKLASVLMRDADDDGMLARFCPVLPQQVPIPIPTREPNTAFAERAFERLYGLELPVGADGIAKPEIVRLAEPAKKLMHEHRLWVREVEDEASGLVRSYIGKTPGAVARISLVLAMLEWAAGDTAKPPEVIDAEVFRRASRYVVDYLYPMVRRAYAEASTAPEEKAARALARSLHARHIERITRSEVLALKLEGLRNGKAVVAAVALLTDACILLEDRVPTGGRDRLEYLVNPRIWE